MKVAVDIGAPPDPEGQKPIAGGEASVTSATTGLLKQNRRALRLEREKTSLMPSTHLSLHYHLVFSTKNREPWLPAAERGRIHEYLGGVIRGLKGVSHAIGGTGDHVHAFVSLRATHCLADVMRELKSESSAWIHNGLGISNFAWQEGYGGFTVSASHIDAVKNYVFRQEEHHRKKSFQEEYLEMLQRGMVEFDEAYLW